MKTRAKRKPVPRPEQLYQGATTCDFAPEWQVTHPELLALLKGAFAADQDDLTPQLVLADWLQEHDDPREKWVRICVSLWQRAGELKVGHKSWTQADAQAALAPVCETNAGWRLANVWGCLIAWHGPSGYDGTPMGRTWADERVRVVQRSLWFWGMGFLSDNPVENAAGRQADAAGSQAYAAGSQADAAGRQADAAGSQAYAAGSQKLWRFARTCWEMCVAELPRLGATEGPQS